MNVKEDKMRDEENKSDRPDALGTQMFVAIILLHWLKSAKTSQL